MQGSDSWLSSSSEYNEPADEEVGGGPKFGLGVHCEEQCNIPTYCNDDEDWDQEENKNLPWVTELEIWLVSTTPHSYLEIRIDY